MSRCLFVFAVALLFTLSCKKAENSESKTRREMLMGTWKWMEYGPDSINLNVLDANETSPFTISTFSVYKDSSKGLRIEKYVSGGVTYIDTLEFTWLLSQDESAIISSYSNPLLAHVDSIHTVNNARLILLDNNIDKGGVYNYWRVLEKQ